MTEFSGAGRCGSQAIYRLGVSQEFILIGFFVILPEQPHGHQGLCLRLFQNEVARLALRQNPQPIRATASSRQIHALQRPPRDVAFAVLGLDVIAHIARADRQFGGEVVRGDGCAGL